MNPMDAYLPPQAVTEFNPMQPNVLQQKPPEEDYVQQFIKANVSQHGLGFS
jgi:hypothetical protein